MGEESQALTFYVKRALPDDESIIRSLLRSTPMQGAIHIRLQREPDANLAAKVEGLKHHSVFVINLEGIPVGMGSRSVRRVYINGQVKQLGYLSQLRAAPGRRGIKRLRAGFAGIKQLHGKDELPYDYTTIIADNLAAKRLLERGIQGLPRYYPLARLSTFIIPTAKRADSLQTDIECAEAEDIPAITSCLQHYSSRYQLAPYWDADTLTDP